MITMSHIRTAVQDEFKLNIKRKCRKRIYVTARTIYFKLCKEFTKYPYDNIGKTLGKDHATVLHAVKNIFQCWEFCQHTSHVDKKHINIYNKIFIRLKTDLDNIKKRKVDTIDYRAQASYWKRKYLSLRPSSRYNKAVINYKKGHYN